MRHSIRIAQALSAAVAISASAAWAQFSFYGYRPYTPRDDSVAHYRQTRLGPVQLEDIEVRIVPRGGYLDITEDAWISGDLTEHGMHDLTDEYLYKGSLPVPDKAVVTGVQTWRYKTMYRARLKPTEYSTEQQYQDLYGLRRALDSRIILLLRHGENSYELMLSHAEIGARRHVRIRYLLPNTGSARAAYTIPVLLHQNHSQRPKFIRMTMHADADTHAYAVHTPSGAVRLSDSSSVIIPYQSSLRITSASQRLDTLHTALHSTRFEDGPYRGTYTLLNTSVTDSLVRRLSRKMETVFIWRWNGYERLTAVENGIRTVSDYGKTIASQARRILDAMETLGRTDQPCALIHSRENGQIENMPMQLVRDTSSGGPREYLARFDQRSIYDRYKNVAEAHDASWMPRELDANEQTSYDREREAFLATLREAVGLFSGSDMMLRHIVLISAGKAPEGLRVLTRQKIDSLLDGATVDAANASWRGVDIGDLLPSRAEQQLTEWRGFGTPGFQPSTIQCKLTSRSSAHDPIVFPLEAAPGKAFAVSFKSAMEWNSRITWIGFDHLGAITDTLSAPTLYYDAPRDSGLVKIWAGDRDRSGNGNETLIGQRYGVLTKATFLQAGLSDTADDTGALPFLDDEEIVYPQPVIARRNNSRNGFQCRLIGAHLEVRLGAASPGAFLELYDPSGRLLLRLALARYHHGGGLYRIDLRAFASVRPGSNLIAVVKTENTTKTALVHVRSQR
jgi:hypothetical protein